MQVSARTRCARVTMDQGLAYGRCRRLWGVCVTHGDRWLCDNGEFLTGEKKRGKCVKEVFVKLESPRKMYHGAVQIRAA
jgi:hypothetical protein